MLIFSECRQRVCQYGKKNNPANFPDVPSTCELLVWSTERVRMRPACLSVWTALSGFTETVSTQQKQQQETDSRGLWGRRDDLLLQTLHFIRIAQWHLTNAKYVCIIMTQMCSGHSHPSHISNHSMILIHRTVRLWSVPSFMSIKLFSSACQSFLLKPDTMKRCSSNIFTFMLNKCKIDRLYITWRCKTPTSMPACRGWLSGCC